MKKILMIAYDFPPAISGVRRTLKFIKYLPEFGWEPIVLTVKPVRSVGYDAKPLDVLQEKNVRVYRSGSLDPYRVHYLVSGAFSSRSESARKAGESVSLQASSFSAGKGLARWLRRWYFVPDDRMLWIPFAFWQALTVLQREGIGYVYTTSFPNSAHVVGFLVKKFRDVRWVADFRDGWVQNPMFFDPPTGLHRCVSSALERAVVRKAELVVSVSEPITEHLRRVSGAGPICRRDKDEKFVTITNGFDEDDFKGLERVPGEKFSLVYAGTFFGKRSPEAFLRGLAQAIDERRELREQIQCLFYSVLEERFERLIRELGLEDVVRVCRFVSHRQVLQEQLNADVLVIVIPEMKNAEIMVTQKVFEYLAARRPILAVVPEGECRRIVLEAKAGVVVSPGDVQGIKEAILSYYDSYKDGTLSGAEPESIKQYSRRELTRTLASAMDAFLCGDSKGKA